MIKSANKNQSRARPKPSSVVPAKRHRAAGSKARGAQPNQRAVAPPSAATSSAQSPPVGKPHAALATGTGPAVHDDEAALARVRARSWFAAFDDPQQLGLFVRYAQAQREAALAECDASLAKSNPSVAVAMREREIAIRVAALEVLFEIPGLLQRPELASHPGFACVFQGVFQVFQSRDNDVLRRLTHRGRGRPDGADDALQTLRLAEHEMRAGDAFAERLQRIVDSTDNDISDAERENARQRLAQHRGLPKRTKSTVIAEVAKFQGISAEAAASRIRKAMQSDEIRAQAATHHDDLALRHLLRAASPTSAPTTSSASASPQPPTRGRRQRRPKLAPRKRRG